MLSLKGQIITHHFRGLGVSPIEVTIEARRANELPKGKNTELAETEVKELSLWHVIARTRKLRYGKDTRKTCIMNVLMTKEN